MPRRSPFLLTLSLILLITPHVTASAGGRHAGDLPVAVLDFEGTARSDPEWSSKLSDLIAAGLSGQHGVIIVERQDMNTLLAEASLSMTGLIEPSTATAIGRLTGAKVLVTGRVLDVDGKVVAVAKLLGTETGRVYVETAEARGWEDSVELAERLTKKLASTLREHETTLVASPESDSDLVAQLRKRLRGKKLPSVSVTVEERHARGIPEDPAAETEIGRLLIALGFTVVEQKSNPDVKIVGEAFSEFAARTGDIVSCRGRVELVVIERKTGTVLAMDHQTEVAVDLGPETAGRLALERSAAKLVERIVEKLIGA